MQQLSSVDKKTLLQKNNYFPGVHLVILGISGLAMLHFFSDGHEQLSQLPQMLLLWSLLSLHPWLSSYFKIRYVVSTGIFCVLSIAMLIHILLLDGGAGSQDIFWLTTIPLAMGVLLGLSGAYVGIAISIVLATLYFALDKNGIMPSATYDRSYTGRFFSYVSFLFFTGFMIRGFVLHQEGRLHKLTEKNMDIENLLRVLVHDIANSLSGMTYNLMRAKEEADYKSSQPPEFERIERAVEDISNLLAQVRHLKSVKDGKATLPLKPISLNVVLNEVYEKSMILAQQKGIRLAWEIAQDRMMIQGEKAILSNVVLQNILNNAIKFSFPGDPVEVRAFPKEKKVFVEIQDYGIGIPAELQSRLFMLDSLTSRQGTRGEKGTGYGMPLVKEYLQMMKGEIQIISRERAEGNKPRGTQVILSLPLAEFEVKTLNFV